MKIDGMESKIVRRTQAYGTSVLADYLEEGGEVGPDERKLIVKILRDIAKPAQDKLPNKTGPKRQEKRARKEAMIVAEIMRVMHFWNVGLNDAQSKIAILNGLNQNTIKSYWNNYREQRPKKTKSIMADGTVTISCDISRSQQDDALFPFLAKILPYIVNPSYRGKLAKTDYPDGYETIGLEAFKI